MSEVRRLKTRGRGLEYVLVELYDYQPQITETSLLRALLSVLTALTKNMSDTTKSANPQEERTFIAIKPDGVQRGLIGEIVKRFEQRGYKLVAAKLMTATKDHLKEHYKDLAHLPFFPGLIDYMNSGPVFAMVWQGTGVVAMGRKMLGATKPQESEPGTIRGDFCIDVGRNICHGSDAVDTAEREIALWFTAQELNEYVAMSKPWVYEK